MALPEPAVAVSVLEPTPGAIAVRFELESGRFITVSLRDLYEPRPSSVDSTDLYSFLIMQSLPPTMVQEAMDGFDAGWERKVQERKRRNDHESGAARYQRMQDAWRVAADDLGIRITVPYVISSDLGSAEYVGFVPDFGGSHGAVFWPRGADDRIRLMAANEAGIFWSQLSESYSTFDRDLFVSTLDDWGWFGQEDAKPDWYTGEPWTT